MLIGFIKAELPPPRDFEIKPLLIAETKSKHLTPVGAGEG